MGVAADLVATIEQFDKEQLGEYAFQSLQKAIIAHQKGYLKKSIIPIYDQNKISILEEDETIHAAMTAEELTAMKPIFPKSDRRISTCFN